MHRSFPDNLFKPLRQGLLPEKGDNRIARVSILRFVVVYGLLVSHARRWGHVSQDFFSTERQRTRTLRKLRCVKDTHFPNRKSYNEPSEDGQTHSEVRTR